MSYDVFLMSVPAKFFLPVATVVRLRCGVGLKDAVELVRRIPTCVASGVTNEEAERLKAELEAGHYPDFRPWPELRDERDLLTTPDKWARPQPGEKCCVIEIRATLS
jgi:hypothetical protein